MDELDYRQVAHNVAKLIDLNVSEKLISYYTRWELGTLRKTKHNYKMVCKVIVSLGFPELTEEEWKKR